MQIRLRLAWQVVALYRLRQYELEFVKVIGKITLLNPSRGYFYKFNDVVLRVWFFVVSLKHSSIHEAMRFAYSSLHHNGLTNR